MNASKVPLIRTFSPVAKDTTSSEQTELAVSWGYEEPTCWAALEKEYRVIILADAGAGKTFETQARAQHMSQQGRTAFFIRLEDLDENFEDAFEVGDASEFEQWLEGPEEAWFFLDSVDEARLDNPKAFEKAIRRFAKRIKRAYHRAHVYITSRPYAWRFKTDRYLVEQLLPFAPIQSESRISEERSDFSEADKPSESVLQLYVLRPLTLDDIRLFAEHRLASDIDKLIADIQRANLIEVAARPFDLESLLSKWKVDGTLGCRLESLQHNIETRLTEIDLDRNIRQPLNRQRAREGAQLLAAAVTLTGEAGIIVPDSTHERRGIEAEQVLALWEPNEVRILLERGIFNDIIYGAVRFRHRDIRELLTAEWLYAMLQKGNSRRQIESLIFREQYGEHVISPRMRPILPWLILFDEPIRRRALALHPEIAVEGGDVAQLPLSERRVILNNIVRRIVAGVDDGSASDNSAIVRIAQPDLSGDVQCLVEEHSDSDEAIFFLGRLIWQGNMTTCLDPLVSIAVDVKRNIYARTASARAISTTGTYEQKISLWKAIINLPVDFPRRLLVELVDGAVADEQGVCLLLASIRKLPPYERYESSGLQAALQSFIGRVPIRGSDAGGQPLARLAVGLNNLLEEKPHFDRRECRVSTGLLWLMKPASYVAERLIFSKTKESFNYSIIEILLKASAVQYWVGEYTEEHNRKLQDFISVWPSFNDELFWRAVAEARVELGEEDERVTDVWSLDLVRHYWKFGTDSFGRILKMIKAKKFNDDKLVALSLAWQVYMHSDMPTGWNDELRKIVAGDLILEERLGSLINPPVTEYQSKRKAERAERERKRKEDIRDQELNNLKRKEKIRSNPDIILNPPGIEPGDITWDQVLLLNEITGDGSRICRGKDGDWHSLIKNFGDDVACAFKAAAMAHWRAYQPSLASEGANTASIPYTLIFAMVGMEIEAQETDHFTIGLTEREASHAMRYITKELNGFPNWFEVIYNVHPKIALSAIWKEVCWELDNSKCDQPMHYVLHDLVYHAPWLHADLVNLIKGWLSVNSLKSQQNINYCITILANGGIDLSWLAEFARLRVLAGEPADQFASWYAVWVDIEPETGVLAVQTWLEGLDAGAATVEAQKFITLLMGTRRSNQEWAKAKSFHTALYLKSLYLLIHKYISVVDDINRANSGVYSPELRDDAQDARNQLFKLLSEIPGKETYIALTELACEHPDVSHRNWMARHARMRAEQDADLEHWDSQQIHDFAQYLELEPTTHRQLFDIGVLHLNDFKDWVERGNDSLAETYQKADDETEVRKVVANWLNQNARGRYDCAQENPLANDQRPDIWLQHPKVKSPVPIELKLLDKGWSGPYLCERLRNQLAGDYLREVTAGCGIFLLVWQGRQAGRNWEIEGERVGVSELRDALNSYWLRISDRFPNVSAIEIIVVDLTLRAEKSET